MIQTVEQSVSVIDNANASPVNYDWGYTSWSLGANYQFNPDVAAFAGAKHALRALAQSMARELGPQGLHVAHVVIDGAIDTAFIAENFPQRYALKADAGILDPESIAEAYWQLHRQPRHAAPNVGTVKLKGQDGIVPRDKLVRRHGVS